MTRGLAVAVALVLAVMGAPAAAQEPPPAPAADTVAASELVFEREVFDYPTFQRRNPFKSLIGDLQAGPRFEQIELRGIILARDPKESVALLALKSQVRQAVQRQVQQETTQQEQTAATATQQDTIVVPEATQRLRVGESWGNTRVLQINRDNVVVEVTEFGQTEQQILRMPARRQGGL